MKSSGSSHYINDVGGVIPAAAGLVPTGASPKKKILEYLILNGILELYGNINKR